jgi:hypothetical protein
MQEKIISVYTSDGHARLQDVTPTNFAESGQLATKVRIFCNNCPRTYPNRQTDSDFDHKCARVLWIDPNGYLRQSKDGPWVDSTPAVPCLIVGKSIPVPEILVHTK